MKAATEMAILMSQLSSHCCLAAISAGYTVPSDPTQQCPCATLSIACAFMLDCKKHDDHVLLPCATYLDRQ